MPKSINIGVVEDDELTSELIIKTLKNTGYSNISCVNNYNDAIRMLETNTPDILLIDIYLDGVKDGIDLATFVNEEYQIPFIFLTSDSQKETIERAKNVSPPAYLVKPFSQEELYCAIEIALYNSRELTEAPKADKFNIDNAIFVKDGTSFVKLLIEDIYYMESDHVYVNIYTKNNKIAIRASLNNFYETLNPNIFYRVHRSYVVNINHVESIGNEFIIIKNQKIPTATKYNQHIFEKFNVL